MNIFNLWNTQKQETEDRRHILPNEREIWWTRIGKNIGFEQDGAGDLFLRPVLILRVFNSKIFFGVPMSSGPKNEKSNYYYKIKHNGATYYALLLQAKIFSTKRLQQRIRTIAPDDFSQIKTELGALLKI